MDWLYLVSLECQWPNKVIRVLLSDLILFSVLICLWCTSLCKVWLDPLWIGQKCWQLILMGTEETAQALTQKTEKRSLPLNLGVGGWNVWGFKLTLYWARHGGLFPASQAWKIQVRGTVTKLSPTLTPVSEVCIQNTADIADVDTWLQIHPF